MNKDSKVLGMATRVRQNSKYSGIYAHADVRIRKKWRRPSLVSMDYKDLGMIPMTLWDDSKVMKKDIQQAAFQHCG